MSRAADAKAKAARLAAQRHTPVADPETAGEMTPVAAPVVAPSRQVAAPRKNVRITLDLAPALYDDFDDWRRRTARAENLTRVVSADVLRVLLRKLMADPNLEAQVIEELRRDSRQGRG